MSFRLRSGRMSSRIWHWCALAFGSGWGGADLALTLASLDLALVRKSQEDDMGQEGKKHTDTINRRFLENMGKYGKWAGRQKTKHM
eukprot:2589352-Pyramimonas_sp.AAC.1